MSGVILCKSVIEMLSSPHTIECPKDLCKPFEGKCNEKIGEFCEINKELCTARCGKLMNFLFVILFYVTFC